MATRKKSISSLKKYLARISDIPKSKVLHAFNAFPKDVEFDGQDSEERVILVIRQHPVYFVLQTAKATGVTFVVVLLAFLLREESIGLSSLLTIGVAILGVMCGVSMLATAFFQWFFSVNIITDERIVDVDFVHIFAHRVSECQLESIEDVAHTSIGLWSTLFDFGSVFVQTAAEQREFEFENVPRPRDIQDTILDLLELKQNA